MGQATLLVALDLSAAFDTIIHSTLLSRLHKSFGISGLALSWLQSYLSNRSQSVCIGQFSSDTAPLTTGVPQGSVLGPILFSTYISPIAQIVANHSLLHQQYADDTQLFVAIDSRDPQQNISLLQNCLTDLRQWLSHNGLCFNPSKSDAVIFGTHQRLNCIPAIHSINVAGTPVQLSNSVTTLGVTLDSHLSFQNHINSICKSCYFHIKALRHIRSSLPRDVCSNLAAAIVQSRLDYANSILYKAPRTYLNRLQRVQNCLAKTVSYTSPSLDSSHLLRALHWLPVHKRIDFKIAVLAFRILSTQQPAYLHDLIHYYNPPRQLRSSDQILLRQPLTRTAFGTRAFSSAAPKIWNAIPLDIRQLSTVNTFKAHLKTFYFTSP